MSDSDARWRFEHLRRGRIIIQPLADFGVPAEMPLGDGITAQPDYLVVRDGDADVLVISPTLPQSLHESAIGAAITALHRLDGGDLTHWSVADVDGRRIYTCTGYFATVSDPFADDEGTG